jgi:hypothetical protein
MEQYADKSFVYGWSKLRRNRLLMARAQHDSQAIAHTRAVAQRALLSRALPVSIHFHVI